jgi:preprotein translocase subunit SecD
MTDYRFWLVVILLITVVSVWIDLPDNPGLHVDFEDDGEEEISADFEVVQGLDLQGGSRILLRPALSDAQYDSDDLEVARDIVERRVNGLGLAEAVVQLQGSNRVLVELPGVSDRDVALATVQSTGLLEFVDYAGIQPTVLQLVSQEGACIKTTEQERLDAARADTQAEEDQQDTAEPTATPPLPDEPTPEVPPFGKVITNVPGEHVAQEGDGEEQDEERGPCPDGSFPVGTTGTPEGPPFRTVMTGAGLDDAAAVFDGLRWQVSFTLNSEGNELFSAHTAANVGQQMAIVLDREVISAPSINSAISGQGVIEGSFTEEEAQSLAIQLRYGALPVPLDVAAFDNVGPTLGRISVNRSIEAGIVGVVVVLLFMIIYYRVPGVAAALALMVFAAMNFALYKSIPVTLTLPAITGFLISIGTAVDGNILIFERMKEELRAGKTLNQSVRLGFDRAWTSIRDSNISTLLICGILFFFGSTFGASAVQGFAITLGLGLVLNLFTAIIVTRTFLAVLLDLFGKAIEGNKRLLGA